MPDVVHALILWRCSFAFVTIKHLQQAFPLHTFSGLVQGDALQTWLTHRQVYIITDACFTIDAFQICLQHECSISLFHSHAFLGFPLLLIMASSCEQLKSEIRAFFQEHGRLLRENHKHPEEEVKLARRCRNVRNKGKLTADDIQSLQVPIMSMGKCAKSFGAYNSGNVRFQMVL